MYQHARMIKGHFARKLSSEQTPPDRVHLHETTKVVSKEADGGQPGREVSQSVRFYGEHVIAV